jgi:DNA-binding transcriptional LysR family regulator
MMNGTNLTLRQLRAFCAVADQSSFTGAAKSLNLSQAALSGLVKELEMQLGTQLLNRTTKHVSVTPVGEAFLPLARSVLADLAHAVENLNNLKDIRRGIVRVAAPEILSCTLLPDLIFAYGQAYPGIEIRFSDVPLEGVIDGLMSGEIDVGIVPGVHREPKMDELVLFETPLWVAFSRENELAKKRRIRWRDLADHTMIVAIRQFAERILSHVPGDSHPARLLQVQRVNTALSMVRRGPDVTVLAAYGASLVKGFDLEFRPLIDPPVNRKVIAITKPGLALAPAAQAFLDFAASFSSKWSLNNRSGAQPKQRN